MQDTVYKKVERLAKVVQNDLRKKGLVIPVDNPDGSVSVDNYTIIRDRSGFYSILNRSGDTVVDKINLPQTAALLANNLALGRFVDDKLLKHDRQYGYSLFEEQMAKKIITNHKDWDKVDVMQTKIEIAQHKKMSAKRTIMFSFEKLRSLR